jgi:hypothetical protein
MPFLFAFLSFDMTGLHRQGRMQPLQGLDAGHLIGAHHMRPLRSQRWGSFIDLTDGADLLGQFGGVLRWGSEPVSLAMGLQRAHLLKTVGAIAASPCR